MRFQPQICPLLSISTTSTLSPILQVSKLNFLSHSWLFFTPFAPLQPSPSNQMDFLKCLNQILSLLCWKLQKLPVKLRIKFPSCTSSCASSLPHYNPVTLASCLFLKHTKFSPTSGPLHILSPLPFPWLPIHYSGLSSNITSLKRPSLNAQSK